MERIAAVVGGILALTLALTGCGSVDVQPAGGCVVTDMTADRICDGNIVFFVDNCGKKTPNIDQNCADQDLICRNGACVVDDGRGGPSGTCGDGVLDLAFEACECSQNITQCHSEDDTITTDGHTDAQCADVGFGGGRLGCINCELQTEQCSGSSGGGCGDTVFEPPMESCECRNGATQCGTAEGEDGVIQTGINLNTWCTQLPGEDFSGGVLRCVGCTLDTSSCD